MFSDSARRLAGLAGALLGWRPAEFWTATPAELAAVLEAMSGRWDGASGAAATREDLDRLERMFGHG